LARGVQGYIKKLKEFLAASGTGKPVSAPELEKNGGDSTTPVDDVKMKRLALQTNENIQAMIKDLFHTPPIYKATIRLSFKPRHTEESTGASGEKSAMKRKPISFPSGGGAGGKKALYMDVVAGKAKPKFGKSAVSNYKPRGKIARPAGTYNPPQGKYSSKVDGKRGGDW